MMEKTGVIGSVPTGSIDIENIGLTPKEKVVARNMGISEDAYLKNKKRIIEIRNKPDED